MFHSLQEVVKDVTGTVTPVAEMCRSKNGLLPSTLWLASGAQVLALQGMMFIPASNEGALRCVKSTCWGELYTLKFSQVMHGHGLANVLHLSADVLEGGSVLGVLAPASFHQAVQLHRAQRPVDLGTERRRLRRHDV